MSDRAETIAADVIAVATRDYAGPVDPTRFLMQVANALIMEAQRLAPGQPHLQDDDDANRLVAMQVSSDPDCLHCCILKAIADYQDAHAAATDGALIVEHMVQALLTVLAPAPQPLRSDLVAMIAAALTAPAQATNRPH